MQPQQQSLSLANGLRVRLYHYPHLKQSAAWLRVAVGSHDVPVAWPGLAHFLEHLFFLGTERFAAEEKLMAFVQRCGGQLNASTRERSTDYFFELPVPAFAGGLQRLCDMLGEPRFSLAEQLREREVLHAEFIAWSRDGDAAHERWLFSPLNAAHPLRAFHAGNRYSLPIPRPAFQRALRDFYQGRYQAGQMTLCLTGPQPLEVLRELAVEAGTLLRNGPGVEQTLPPALLDGPIAAHACTDRTRLNLLFACENLPADTHVALDFLATWISSGQPGGLLARLRLLGWADSLQLIPTYQFAGQALVNLELRLSESGQAVTAQVAELCLDWLEYFRAHDDWSVLRDEYALLRERRRWVAGALGLAGQLSQPPNSDDGAESMPALRALLGQMCRACLVHALPPAASGFTSPCWQLPAPNRFLRIGRRPEHDVAGPTSMTWLPGPVSPLATLRVRWRLRFDGDPRLWKAADHALGSTAAEAEQAGVKLQFSGLGQDWTLLCSGIASALVPVLEQALALLTAPPDPLWNLATVAAPPQIPIRQLLRQLPELSSGHTSQHAEHEQPAPAALARALDAAQWDGLAVGLPECERNALNEVLLRMPGHPALKLDAPPPPWNRWQWHTLPTPSSEHAMLLFCPVQGATLVDEAAWRLLGELIQGSFYQRLRVELQLGYAVFSGWRQFAGRAGLLFGVQSPSTTVGDLLRHIEAFIDAFPSHIAGLGAAALTTRASELAGRFVLAELEPDKAGEWLWQAKLAARDADYLPALQQALSELDQATVLRAAHHLSAGSAGRLVLANGMVEDPYTGSK